MIANLANLLLKKRANEKELLDLGPSFYSPHEYIHCQKVLFKINTLLGIVTNIKCFLKQFASNMSVLDVGCGGGLLILKLGSYFPKNNFIGCDISEDAIKMAEIALKESPYKNVSFYLQQQHQLNYPENSVDIILANLVCHHIEDHELIDFFRQSLLISRQAVLINDLHRHIIAYYFYKIFSPLFRNRLINHDGLISIKRGFTRKELSLLLEKANINKFSIKWRFPFCWSVVLWKS